jgi:hypothetical protein
MVPRPWPCADPRLLYEHTDLEPNIFASAWKEELLSVYPYGQQKGKNAVGDSPFVP